MNVKYIGNHALVVDRVLCDRNVKELIRLIDSNKMEMKICEKKFNEHHEKIDLDARRQFHGATRSTVKCMIGFNHYGARHKMINKKLTSTECLRCSENETWEYVVQCRAIANKNRMFINELTQELKPLVKNSMQE